MTTFCCGVEEPLQPNEQLYALDEGSGSIVLADFSNAQMHRYSFVPSDACLGADFLGVIRRVAPTFGDLATWIVAFRDPEPTRGHRPRVLANRLASRGWRAVKRNGLHLSIRPITFENEQTLPPADADVGFCGWCVLLGPRSEDESLLAGPFAATLDLLARGHRLAPSKEFVAACGDASLGVAYLSTDALDRPGLVVVAPHQISHVIRDMKRDGLVGRLLLNADASSLWR